MQSYHYDSALSPAKGKEPTSSSLPTASQPFPYQRRRPLSHPTFVRPQTALTTSRSLGALEVPLDRKTNTWTSSSGDLGLVSEGEVVDGREEFVDEYNRLAKRYGVRLLIPGDFPVDAPAPTRKGSWFSKAVRRTSSGQSTQTIIVKSDQIRRRRSVSDAALNIIQQMKRDTPKSETLQDLVRLCGKSLFYLPSEYTPCSLVLPTCFRALAQALIQQANTRGIFRVPGSVRVVNTLYDYYCADRDGSDVSATTRCPNLPSHIKCNVHDIASAFKKFLAGLPGGILGSLSLFDALVAIHSQLHVDPELTKTKETKLRARLIALAIGTVRSQYQRELICAVFGTLCFIGRAAENTPREDQDGRPLPTTDLMGYNALGIVFGPLLINDLIDSYKMRVADPAGGLVLLPVSPPKSRKERRKNKKPKSNTNDPNTLLSVDKIHVAKNIAEMLITHWREVVRQMRSLGTLKIRRNEGVPRYRASKAKLVSSASDSFPLRKPPKWDGLGPSNLQKDRDVSPMGTSPSPTPKNSLLQPRGTAAGQPQPPAIRRRRSRPFTSSTPCGTSPKIPTKCLSPTAEESPSTDQHVVSVARESHLVSSSAVRTPPRHNLGNVLIIPSTLGGSEDDTESQIFNSNKKGRNREWRTNINLHENVRILHNGSQLSHVLSGSEITFHSVRSSRPDVSTSEEYSSRNGGTPKTKELNPLGEWPFGGLRTPTRSLISAEEPSGSHAGGHIHAQTQSTDPADKWKALVLASSNSTENLAKAAKERRLRRSPGSSDFWRSEESLVQRATEPATPQWKRQLRGKRTGEKWKPAKLSPEKKNLFENPLLSEAPGGAASPHKPEALSPAKSAFEEGSRPVSRRSSSKPLKGAVKAMAALFDNNIQDSPASSRSALIGRIGRGSKEHISIVSPYSGPNSPWRELGSSVNRYNLGLDSPRKGHEHTPSKLSQVSSRPAGYTFSASRKVPVTSSVEPVPLRDRELSQPPSLGTMVPHPEEPPIAQHIAFARPSLSASPVGRDGSDIERASTGSPRPGSSNSMLHSRIRHLQKQLELRIEESTQLRRQLEARENMDIGKLCEQLRAAKRECKMWRERAEAAERRVAVFKQFTARIRGLRDTAVLEDADQDSASRGEQVDGPSHRGISRKTVSGRTTTHSEHMENPEGLKGRVRQYMNKQLVPSADDKPYTDDGGVWGNSGVTRKQGLWKNIPDKKTAQLWDITDELLMLDDTNIEGESQRGLQGNPLRT